MNLKEILVGIDGIKGKGNIDLNITNVDSDSRNIKENGLFFFPILEISPLFVLLKWLHLAKPIHISKKKMLVYLALV